MNSVDPLVSVIVPCYNQEKYVLDALKSVQHQSYSHFECIIVNDGSTDNSKEVIAEFCREDSRFHLLDKENQGVSVARNYGIEHSHGEFILPLDADDKIAPEYLREAIEVFKSHQEVKLVYSKTQFFGKLNCEFDLPTYDYPTLICRNHIVCTAMYRRVDFDKTNGYNPQMKGWEDWDFWLSFLSPDDKVYRIDKVLFFYRIKKQSRNVNANSNIEDIRRQIWENHKSIYSQTFMNPVLCEEYRRIYESREYKLGSFLLRPIRKLLSFVNC